LRGTLLNAAAVIGGTLLGSLLGNRFSDRMRITLMNGLGLVTVVIGITMAIETSNILLVLGSIIAGGIIGELIDIDSAINHLGATIEKNLTKGYQASRSGEFARGFVTASLLFCVGPMAIMGSIQDGLTGDFSTLAIKASLDGFAAIAFSSTLGMGVGLSAFSVLVYQGMISMGAGFFKDILTEAMINELTATGGVLILAIGLGLLEIKRIKVANLLPAIFMAPLLHYIVSLFK